MIADQLGAKLKGADISGSDSKRPLGRIDCLELLAANIAQAADIDPQQRVIRAETQSPVESLPGGRKLPLQLLKFAKHPETIGFPPFGELTRSKPFARFGQLPLQQQRFAHRGGNISLARPSLQCAAQFGFGGDAIALAQRRLGLTDNPSGSTG